VYTSHMSWPYRVLILTMVVVWGLIPQIACFMPDQSPTQAEMDCCQKKAPDCGEMNMTCCRTVGPAQIVGINAKPVRNPMPDVDVASAPVSIAVVSLPAALTGSAIPNDHAPPYDSAASSLILRI
jgi:hypothetical protein